MLVYFPFSYFSIFYQHFHFLCTWAASSQRWMWRSKNLLYTTHTPSHYRIKNCQICENSLPTTSNLAFFETNHYWNLIVYQFCGNFCSKYKIIPLTSVHQHCWYVNSASFNITWKSDLKLFVLPSLQNTTYGNSLKKIFISAPVTV